MDFILYELLLSVLNMSIIASYVIVFVLIVRLLLKKAPKIFSYSLWAVVLIRLLLPFSFESDIGLLPSNTQPIPQNIVHTEYPEVELPFPAINEVINENLPQGDEQLVADPLETPILIGTLVWSLGTTVMIIFSIISYLKLRKRLIGVAPIEKNIYISDYIDSPFVMGLIKPKIYLPSNLMDNEREFIIKHEQTHIKRLDHITRIIAFITLCIHWFNPFVWIAFILAGKDMEASCDEAVIKKMNINNRADYSQALLKFATNKKLTLATPLAFGEGDTKGRVKNVMKYKKPMIWVSAFCLILVGVIIVSLMSSAKEEFISSSISFGDDKEFEITLYEENTSAGFGNTLLNQGDEVKISIWSENDAEIQVGINPTDEFDNINPEEFIGETVLLTNEPQEIVVEVPEDGMYRVSFINTANQEVSANGTVEYTTDLNDIEPIPAMITEIDKENYTMKVEPLDNSGILNPNIILDVKDTEFTNDGKESSIDNFSVGYNIDVYVNLANVDNETMFPFMISMSGTSFEVIDNADGVADTVQVILAGGNPAFGNKSKIITDTAEVLEILNAFDTLVINEDEEIEMDISMPSYYRLYDGDTLIKEYMFNGNDTNKMWVGQFVKHVEYEGSSPYELYQQSSAEEFVSYQSNEYTQAVGLAKEYVKDTQENQIIDHTQPEIQKNTINSTFEVFDLETEKTVDISGKTVYEVTFETEDDILGPIVCYVDAEELIVLGIGLRK